MRAKLSRATFLQPSLGPESPFPDAGRGRGAPSRACVSCAEMPGPQRADAPAEMSGFVGGGVQPGSQQRSRGALCSL